MKKQEIVIAIFFLVAGLETKSAENGLILGGRIYSDLGAYHYMESGSSDSVVFTGMSTLALDAVNSNRRYAKVKAQLDIVSLYGQAASRLSTPDNRTTGLDFSSGAAGVLFDLRELYFALYPAIADIAVGRQIVNFGTGMILSPLDVFSRINVWDLDFRRGGSDVANVRVPTGALSGIDMIAEMPLAAAEHTSAFKFFTTVKGFDFGLTGMYRHRSHEKIAGISFKGDMVAGVYGEAVGHLSEDRSWFEGMVGGDYSLLHNDLLFTLEYSYNGRPIDPDTLSVEQLGTLDKLFIRRHYLFFNTGFTYNELLSFAGNILWNIDDYGMVGTQSTTWNMLQNVTATFYVRGFHNSLMGVDTPGPNLETSVRLNVVF